MERTLTPTLSLIGQGRERFSAAKRALEILKWGLRSMRHWEPRKVLMEPPKNGRNGECKMQKAEGERQEAEGNYLKSSRKASATFLTGRTSMVRFFLL